LIGIAAALHGATLELAALIAGLRVVATLAAGLTTGLSGLPAWLIARLLARLRLAILWLAFAPLTAFALTFTGLTLAGLFARLAFARLFALAFLALTVRFRLAGLLAFTMALTGLL
jgi:hypothetical protein